MNWLKFAICKFVNDDHILGRKFKKERAYFYACTYCGHVQNAPAPVKRQKNKSLSP